MGLYPGLTGLSNGQSCCGSDEIWEHYAHNLDLYTSARTSVNHPLTLFIQENQYLWPLFKAKFVLVTYSK